MSNDSADSAKRSLPEWVPDEYDPDAPLRERLPIIAEMNGGVEIHVRDNRGTVEIVGAPQHFYGDESRAMTLCAGYRDDDWSWEIISPTKGDARLMEVDPMQSAEAYESTKTVWLRDIDVRVYGVDSDRFEEGA